jgi:hypothetical protein
MSAMPATRVNDEECELRAYRVEAHAHELHNVLVGAQAQHDVGLKRVNWVQSQ